MKFAEYRCECQRYFVESQEVNSKGKSKSIPVTVRKMHLHGDFIFTDYYCVSLVKRNGEVRFSVKMRKKPLKSWWDTSETKEFKMVREGSYTRGQFIEWLRGWVPYPETAVVELETCPPDNLAA